MSYWDTSCLVKVYTPEHDSLLFRNYLLASARCVTSDITPLEFWSTVRRKESEGILAPGEAAKVQSALEGDITAGLITVVICDSPVQSRFRLVVDRCYARNPPIWIRTNDALHLAAAQQEGESEIVATDKRLREAALALGFNIFPLP
ncbi:MAG: type II toxin-antitoxin system VapC family toxin [Verrucomicrobia bacterium]|nr:type II toxin-antitoxin system VapC family toxin [Verrucomicrobiota bacterium]